MIGNGVVMVVILLNKNIEKTSSFNLLIFSLAATDFMVSFVGLPNYLLSSRFFPHPVGRQGDWMCKLFTGYFCPFFLLDLSAFLLVHIALERRRAILHPLTLLHYKPLPQKLLMIFMLFIIALLLGLPTVYGMSYDKENNMVGNFCKYNYSETESIYIYFVVFILDTVIPAAIMVYCYYQINSCLKQNNALLKSSSGSWGQNKRILGSKYKTMRTLTIVTIVFFVCIVPNHLLYILSLTGVKGLRWNSAISQVGVLIRFSNSCINPVIYSLKSQEFNRHLFSVFGEICKSKKQIRYQKYSKLSINA